MSGDVNEDGERSNLSSKTASWLVDFNRDLLAGEVMGGVVDTIVAPVERAELLLQTQESNIAILRGGRRKFKGMFDYIVRTVREEGFLSLWRGNGRSVLRYYPSVALNFSLKGVIGWFDHVYVLGILRIRQGALNACRDPPSRRFLYIFIGHACSLGWHCHWLVEKVNERDSYVVEFFCPGAARWVIL